MVEQRICQPLKLDDTQKAEVTAAFKVFFNGMDKLMDKSSTRPAQPEKAKVDVLAKVRDEKVKQAIPVALFTKYLELEMTTRPKGPEGRRP